MKNILKSNRNHTPKNTYGACTITCYILCLLQHSAIANRNIHKIIRGIDLLYGSKLSAIFVFLLVSSPSAPIPCCCYAIYFYTYCVSIYMFASS